jgi:hypothetical protein
LARVNIVDSFAEEQCTLSPCNEKTKLALI